MAKYPSNKSAKFEMWLHEELNDEKIKKLILLERAARLASVQYELTGDIDAKTMHMLQRRVGMIAMEYDKFEVKSEVHPA